LLLRIKKLKKINNFQCNSGKKQSPIDLSLNPINSMNLNDNIFFDFKELEFCHSDKNSFTNCKLPQIKNNGKVIDIEDDCGKLIMPQHLNGYRCYKVSLHTPAEHKLSI
jgi:carbonic anhydrase